MSSPMENPSLTVLESLVAAIRAAGAYDRNDQVAPAAILWPDEERQWEELLPRLRGAMPELITLGAYDAGSKTGPAIWIKCMLAQTESGEALLPEASWGSEVVPVVYLPGVGKQKLRAIEECPAEVKPLAELQYRGVVWTQVNGKDWTVRAFMQSSEGGLGLKLAADQATLTAMRQSLPVLADVPVARLTGRALEASFFHEMLAPDPARTMLDWLSDPTGFRERTAAANWTAFRTICKDKFSFNPEKSDPVKAGQLLADRQGVWAGVWSRFEENPALYPGVRDLLRRSKMTGTSLFADESKTSIYPQDNEAAETELRGELAAVAKLSEAGARERLRELELEHGKRRDLVWAKLGEASLAQAIGHLAELSDWTGKTLGGATTTDMAELYAEWGWRGDEAAMAALAAVKSAEDSKAVGGAVAAVYGPWLQKAAQHLQSLVASHPLPTAGEAQPVRAEPGCCLVFADGLRMDLGQRVLAELQRRGLTAKLSWRWSTVPSVTATAKPAASPVSGKLNKESEADDFVPQIADGGKTLTSDRFRALLVDLAVTPLAGGETGDPQGAAWLEVGTIDHRGHSEGAKLALLLEDEVRLVADRVEGLVNAGWPTVRVVTDHGWLLLPGGLPRVSLPRFLVATRWGRCAVVKPGANPEGQQHGWHWNPKVSIATAPGTACYREGHEYAHGGISVQESVVPVIHVTAGGGRMSGVRIESVAWNNLTGRVEVSGTGAVAVDLRRDGSNPATSLLDGDQPRPLDKNGRAKVYALDTAESAEADVVALDMNGKVLAALRTKVGLES